MLYFAVEIYDFHRQNTVQELDSTFSNYSFNSNFWPFALQYVIHVFFFTFTASHCGQHWHAYKSGCLRLFQDHKGWVAAKDHCANFSTPGKGNGRLISIFSQDENNQIVNLWSSLGFAEGVVSSYYCYYFLIS